MTAVPLALPLLLILLPALYLALLIWLVFQKSWPVRGGLALVVVSLLPVAWVLTLPPQEFDSPGAGFALMIMVAPPLLLSLLVILAGFILAIVRLMRSVRANPNIEQGD